MVTNEELLQAQIDQIQAHRDEDTLSSLVTKREAACTQAEGIRDSLEQKNWSGAKMPFAMTAGAIGVMQSSTNNQKLQKQMEVPKQFFQMTVGLMGMFGGGSEKNQLARRFEGQARMIDTLDDQIEEIEKRNNPSSSPSSPPGT